MLETEPSDLELVRASRAGKVAAFSAIVERYQGLVCAVAYSACGSVALSEDVAQDTFVTAWTTLPKLADPAKLRSWLCSIASNKARDVLRKRKREVPQDDADLASRQSADPSPREVVMSTEQEAEVWTALAQVPATYRDVLVLFYREDQSIKQVSSLLGLSIAAVKQRLKRGREALRETLAPIGPFLAESRAGKAFTIGVVAAIAAKSGTAAAASASAAALGPTLSTKSVSATSASFGAASWLAIGALALVLAAAALFYVSRSSERSSSEPATVVGEAPEGKTFPRLYSGPRVSLAASGDHELVGVVLDTADNPVAGAVVTVSGDPPRVVSSGPDGRFVVGELAAQAYGVSAFTAEGASIPTAVRVRDGLAPIVLRIETGSTIEIEVLAHESGLPIAGAIVAIESGLRHSEETTDAAGVVRFSGVTATDNIVYVVADGYARLDNAVLIAGDPATYRRVFLLRRGAPFDLSLVSASGEPIDGALASLQLGPEAIGLGSGKYRFEAAPPGPALLFVTHDDFLPLEHEMTISSASEKDAPSTEPVLTMSRGKTIRGVIVDAAGAPVPGARVAATGDPMVAQDTVADEAGAFVLRGLTDEVTLTADHEGKTSSVHKLAIEGAEKTGLRVEIADHCIRGRAQSRSGSPAVSARVQATPLSDDFVMLRPAMDQTDENGAFALCAVVAGGSYRIAAVARGVSPSFFEQSEFGEVVAEAGASDVRIEVAEPGRLVGTMSVAGEFGVAVAAARFDLTHAPARPFSGKRFTLEKVPPGTYAVSIVANGAAPIVLDAVEIRAGETTDLGELALSAPARYSGLVLDAEGAPVAGATVLADVTVRGNGAILGRPRAEVDIGGDPFSLPVFEAGTTVTDGRGRFTVEYRAPLPGRLTLVADHPSRGRSRPVLAPARGADVALKLERTGSIEGRVAGGGPALVICARGAASSTFLEPAASSEQIVVTGKDGNFRFDRVAVGDYRVSAGSPEAQPRISANAKPLRVWPGKVARVRLEEPAPELPLWDADGLDRLEVLVAGLCECADVSCGIPLDRRIAGLFRAYSDPSERVFGRYDALSTRLDRCLEALLR